MHPGRPHAPSVSQLFTIKQAQKRGLSAPGSSVLLDHPIDRLDDPISGLDQASHVLLEAAIGFLKRGDQLGEAF